MGRHGRKAGAVGEKTRSLLLSTAASEFIRNGYHDTKISSIVSKAGLTQPSFYLYFESKQAIFTELVDRFQDNLRELIKKSRVDPGLTQKETSSRICSALTKIFEFFLEDRDLTKIGLFISSESNQIKEVIASLMKENLIAEQAAGYFRAELDMAFVTECLLGVIMSLVERQLLTGINTPENLASQIVDFVLYGLVPNE